MSDTPTATLDELDKIGRKLIDPDIARREDRATLLAVVIETHQRRTKNGPWTINDQLLIEYLMHWADAL